MGAESVFYPDWMQPDWLPTRRQRRLVTIGLGLAAGLPGGLAVGLVAGLVGGLAEALAIGLAAGMAIGFGTDRTRNRSRIEQIEPTRWSWSTARSGGLGVGLVFGVVVGLVFWLVVGLVFGLTAGLVAGLVAGLGLGLVHVLTSGFVSRPNVWPAAPLEGIRAAGQVGRNSGLASGLALGLAFGLVAGLVRGLALGLAVGLAVGLTAGLYDGLRSGGLSYLRHRLLVALLQRQGLIPAHLIGFLDYADGHILLRRVGGGYLFIHRLLQDYFRNRVHQIGPSHATGNQQAARVL
jgi:hypothetical protein